MDKFFNRLIGMLLEGRKQLLLLALAVGLVYFPFLNSAFFFDDIHFFQRAAKYYATSVFHLDLRWFSYATLGWSVTIFSDVVPHFFHLGNAFIHLGNAILLLALMQRLGGLILLPEPGVGFTRGALAAALIFAMHPVAVYAVGYVVQRSILMATFFGLLMFWAYLQAAATGQRRWLLLSVVSYFIACFSKEHSALLPTLIAALAILLRGQGRIEFKMHMLVWLGYASVFLLVVLRANGVFGMPYEPMAAQLFVQQGLSQNTPGLHLLSILTQAGLFFKYLLLWLLPNPAWMSVDMRESLVNTVSDWHSWLGLVGYLWYGSMALYWLRQGGERGLAGFALLYPWLLFPIEFAAIRVQEPFVLYRSYLWMPGLLLLIPLILRRLPERRWLTAMVVIVLVLVPLSWNRLWVFADNYRMWDDAARLLENERVSGADRIYFNRAKAEAAAGKWQEATLDLERALALSPQLAPVHYHLGIAYANTGRNEEALAQFDSALALDDKDARVYYSKAMVLRRLKRATEARVVMEKSCQLDLSIACLILYNRLHYEKQ